MSGHNSERTSIPYYPKSTPCPRCGKIYATNRYELHLESCGNTREDQHIAAIAAFLREHPEHSVESGIKQYLRQTKQKLSLTPARYYDE
jgi:NMD protein affecting ribosome stability and mRNA decay